MRKIPLAVKQLFFGFCILISLGLFVSFTPSFAQGDPAGLDPLSYTGLSSEDPRIVTSRIINRTLGFLGTITLIIIIFGGFKWMTAGGNEEQVSSAKKILIAGIIGLAIILASYGIATYVVKRIAASTY